MSHFLLSFVKALLEEGDAFPNQVYEHGRLVKWSLSQTLLLGVVLSNAYKNKNACIMVTPRKAIPCKYFS